MEESTKPRSVLYVTANDALSYARGCCDHDDQEGETIALKHAVELILDLLEGKEVEPVQLVLGTRATYKDIEEILETIPLWGNDYADY